MPIKFRCTHCKQLLSVSRKKSGSGVTCPACGGQVNVPTIEGFSPPRREPDEADVSRFDIPVPSEIGPSPAHQDTRSVWESELGDWEEHPAFHNAPRRSIKDEADMTSMVDVTFLLLVFFMITASFSVTKALQTQPPTAEEGAASSAQVPMTMDDLAAESVIVEIGADDTIVVDDVPVAGPVELGEVLISKIANEGKTEMVIEAEYRATHGIVVAATDAGMQAGMQRVRRVSRAQEE